jgi:UDP-N-acetyl-2-amino-2-deoxyglucuronate dehydrogenase
MEADKASGMLELENANVSWYLSLDSKDLPESALKNNLTTFRSITIDNKELEFSGGFTDLHTLSYENILAGKGFGIKDSQQSIEIAHKIRNQELSFSKADKHPFVKK